LLHGAARVHRWRRHARLVWRIASRFDGAAFVRNAVFSESAAVDFPLRGPTASRAAEVDGAFGAIRFVDGAAGGGVVDRRSTRHAYVDVRRVVPAGGELVRDFGVDVADRDAKWTSPVHPHRV